jgi:hypothetical protein
LIFPECADLIQGMAWERRGIEAVDHGKEFDALFGGGFGRSSEP